ncbi:oxygen regulatory protein NreC [Patiriisocius marinus]|uniref:Oxygen regulatory protein NreC n=1 Tax=Patiriisocius marinus TaxID=1397112 RepID=A0A5J4J190_9FLAO|nr:response regulator transcription factor [Patiriisocius marinus]GER59758.1 oxygen regulatory protein NreC [Patiriisocius marinus]
MIKIAIAEDHQSLIDGIELLLKYEIDIKIIGTANDGEELLRIVRRNKPNVVITDIKMPKTDGIEATKLIKQEFPETKIIGFSMFDQQEAIQQMIAAGATGYLLKNSPLEEVLNAIKTVHLGGTFYDKNINPKFLTETVTTTQQKTLLSKSEKEILLMIGQGKSSNEIAALRFTSVSTVEKHRKNMIRKLGLQGKGELLRYSIEKKYDF